VGHESTRDTRRSDHRDLGVRPATVGRPGGQPGRVRPCPARRRALRPQQRLVVPRALPVGGVLRPGVRCRSPRPPWAGGGSAGGSSARGSPAPAWAARPPCWWPSPSPA